MGKVIMDGYIKKFRRFNRENNIKNIFRRYYNLIANFIFLDSIVKNLSQKYKNLITILDDFSYKKDEFIGFSTIKDFKGLENDIIICVDLNNDDILNAYVCFSRDKKLFIYHKKILVIFNLYLNPIL